MDGLVQSRSHQILSFLHPFTDYKTGNQKNSFGFSKKMEKSCKRNVKDDPANLQSPFSHTFSESKLRYGSCILQVKSHCVQHIECLKIKLYTL